MLDSLFVDILKIVKVHIAHMIDILYNGCRSNDLKMEDQKTIQDKSVPTQQLSDKCYHCCEGCIYHQKRSFLSRHKIFFLVLFLFFFFVIIPMILFFGFVALILTAKGDEDTSMVLSGQGEDKIAVLNIDGVIVEREPIRGLGAFSEDVTSARRVKSTLNEIKEDSSVKALIVRIDSPGGSAAAAEEIYKEIKRYKEETGDVVIAYFSDLAASGGYYVAMSADRIVANPSTITGSIGVIVSYINFQDLAENYGVRSIVYKSGEHKDLISEFRMPTEEEREIMQEVVNDVFENFIQAVVTGRGLDQQRVRILADGRIYSSNQAKEEGLIDEIGTFEDAVTLTKSMANLKDALVVEYGLPRFWEFLLGSFSGNINVSLPFFPSFEGFGLKPGPRVMYLYTP